MAFEYPHQLLTVAEVAERLRLHPITIRRHIKSGLLPAVRIGRAVRVRSVDVEAWAGKEAQVSVSDLGRRRRLVEEILARRDARKPIDTSELVREARRELEERAERWASPGRRRVSRRKVAPSRRSAGR
jgi:excisionase family DNA binding protein